MNPSPATPRASLLIVDDTPGNLRLLSEMLKRSGYNVRPAPSGELALQAARLDPPDLILLDINMPEMDGYEVCRQLRLDPRLLPIPIIFISALHETLDKIKAFGMGGVDYITKPFQFEEVEARVRTHLELRRRELMLQESYARLQSLEQLRDNLVHMVVHDMRSQLTVVTTGLGLMQIMNDEGQEPDGKLLRNMAGAAGQLNEMITQLLDISRLEAGQMPLRKTVCDLALMAREVMDSLAGPAAGRELRLAAPAPCLADCDQDLVRRVLVNLLANAIKFTPRNGTVAARLSRQAGQVRIAVTDTGPGIPPEFHQRVFEKFAQVEAGHKRQGTGLGLTFCKLAVEAQGGRIGVESVPGQGSTFWFTLPARELPAALSGRPAAPGG